MSLNIAQIVFLALLISLLLVLNLKFNK